MSIARSLFIPVILGTVRKGRASEYVAKFVFSEVQKREGVETELIDLRDLKLAVDDAGEQIKDAKFSATIENASRFALEMVLRSSLRIISTAESAFKRLLLCPTLRCCAAPARKGRPLSGRLLSPLPLMKQPGIGDHSLLPVQAK